MKAKSPTKDLTLVQIIQRFDTDEKARKHLEAVLWPNGVVCPKCQCNDQTKFGLIKPSVKAKTRSGLRWCSECGSKFTVTMGTIFEDSHIPLGKWLVAWYLICSSKKGISSLQLQRLLELGSYRSSLFMTHRIRHALKNESYAEKLSGIVEADEAAIGGVSKGKGTGFCGKIPVMAMVQRGGNVRSQVMKTVSAMNLQQAIRDNVQAGSEVHTDALMGYRKLAGEYQHHSVKHGAGEFSRREGDRLVTTANVESFFGLLKRGIMGTFHHISEQHLPLYLAEFEHRHNCRKLTDGERTDAGLQKAIGKRLIYQVRA